MKKSQLFSLILLLVTVLFVQDSVAQDLTQSSLPEGAIARLGHGYLGSMVFSPDGQRIAVASSIGIYLATPHDLTLIPTRSGVVSVAFSPDGKILASVAWGDPILLWDVETREIIATLEGHTDDVNSVAFSPDGKTLATGDRDNTILLWDVETREIIATLEGHTDDVNSVAFSPDGKTLASGSGDGTVLLWDVASGTNIATHDVRSEGQNRLGSDRVLSVAFSPDGKILATRSAFVKLWDVASDTHITDLVGEDVEGWWEGASSVAFSPDGALLAAGGAKGQAVGCGLAHAHRHPRRPPGYGLIGCIFTRWQNPCFLVSEQD